LSNQDPQQTVTALAFFGVVMNQSQRTVQEYRSTLRPAEILAAAKSFFTTRNSLYAAFLEKEGPGYLTFRGQGGEELVIAAAARDGATVVTGSTYLFDMQIARFFSTLPPFELVEDILPPGPAAEQVPERQVRA
jgi:hypothetical protein